MSRIEEDIEVLDINEIFEKYNLVVRSRESRDYIYVYISNPFIKKTIYIGKYAENRRKLLQYIINSREKELHYSLMELINKNYKLKYLTKYHAKIIDIFRVLYYFSLKNYSKSDIQYLEENRFTEYVNGTTNVEGNTYTLKETELTLNQELTVSGKTAREFYEIINYKELKKYLDTLSKITINADFIKKIHSFILKNIDDEAAGNFRGIDVGIRGSNLSPTPHILIEDEIEALVDWYNKEKDILHPIELIVEFHHNFERIHPFIDGNGRVGRELMRLQLHEYQFPTIPISIKNREQYLKALELSDNGKLDLLIDFILKLAFNELRSLVEQLFDSFEQFLNRIGLEEKVLNLDQNELNLNFDIIIDNLKNSFPFK